MATISSNRPDALPVDIFLLDLPVQYQIREANTFNVGAGASSAVKGPASTGDKSSILTISGSGFTYNPDDGNTSTVDGPTGGSITSASIYYDDISTAPLPGTIVAPETKAVLNIVLDTPVAVQPGMFNDKDVFYHTLLAGNDTGTINILAVQKFAGDGRNVTAAFGPVTGGNDQLTFVGTPERFFADPYAYLGSHTYSGDFLEIGVGATARGGDDVLVYNGPTIMMPVMGDAEFVRGTLTGGNDTIFLNGALFLDILAGLTGVQAFGDAQEIMASDVPGQPAGVVIGGNDTIVGSAFGDRLSGDVRDVRSFARLRPGNDVLFGEGGNDTIYGDYQTLAADGIVEPGGNDVIVGGAGVDALYGQGGDDLFILGSAADYITGEIIDGGPGTDTLLFKPSTAGEKLVLFWSENVVGLEIIRIGEAGFATSAVDADLDARVVTDAGLTIFGSDGRNQILGTRNPDNISGLAGADTLLGYDGDDTLDGGAGNDDMEGRTGNDVYVVDSEGDRVLEGAFDTGDEVRTTLSVFTLGVTASSNAIENLTFIGSGGFRGTGSSVGNVITGSTGSDSLDGLGGADTLRGGLLSDTLNGGPGDDVLEGDSGSDTLNGDEGNDTLYAGLRTNTASSGSPEQMNGGADNDTLYGSRGNDTLDGGAGDDSMVGGDGGDLYVVDAPGDRVTENVNEGNDTIATTLSFFKLGGLVEGRSGQFTSLAGTAGDFNVENLSYSGRDAFTGIGNEFDNRINGSTSDSNLSGDRGNDTLSGGLGNDTLNGGAGADSMNGDIGRDTLSYTGTVGVMVNLRTGMASGGDATGDVWSQIENVSGTNLADTLVGASDANVLSGNGGADVLIGDGPLSLSAEAQSIRRLYIATLDRAPDDGGWIDWTTQRESGVSLNTIAAGFVNSSEFQAKYGPLDNAQFVTQLYRNVLDRAPDAGGLSAYTVALTTGALTRTQVVTAFSESAEFVGGTSTALHAGQVYRLYGATLARAPDAGGFETWTDGLGGGRALVDITAGFVNSSEFQQLYGALSNPGFVTLLYQNVLGRAPDTGGLAFWTGQLDSSAQSRTQVVTGFSESAEYTNGTRTGVDGFMRTVMAAWSDTLIGGAGDDKLTGGRGSDRFVFLASEGGNDTVYGFESFDTLQLTGFGFASSAAVLAAVTQQGANAVLSYTGGSITFTDTQVSVLQSLTAQGWVLG